MNGKQSYGQHQFRASDDATEILLVRHGASQAYVPGEPFAMLGDQGDPPLAPEGRAQAKLVGDRLALEPIDAVYITKLQRTRETAAPLLAQRAIEPQVSPHLHEIHLGEWEGGLTRVYMADPENPIAKEVMRSGTFDAIPGAESSTDFLARVQLGLNEIAEVHPGQNVVAFVHGGVIAAAARLMTNASERFGPVDNCSITHLVFQNGHQLLKSFNDTTHLGPTFTRV